MRHLEPNEITYGGTGAYTTMLWEYQPLVEAALDSWDRQQFSRLLWAKDPAPWKQPKGTPELVDRLGWLTVVDTMLNHVEEVTAFARKIKEEHFSSVVVLGMGGSSLSPEVSFLTFGSAPGFPRLFVLDTTVPSAIKKLEKTVDLPNTLFVTSSKTGGTIETLSACNYFLDRLHEKKKDRAKENFIAITDPGTPLDDESRFRKVFRNLTDIGGRYSALSYFGLVPAALIGVDIAELLKRARKMTETCGEQGFSLGNPGVALGAIMAECALRGRDKLTLVFSPELESFGHWVEQLVAESTGKDGRGILPIQGEPLGPPDACADDRLFVFTKLTGSEINPQFEALAESGHPVVEIYVDDLLDLGGEYFRWEFASAVASAFLAVNAFNQPDVAAAKRKTREFLDERKEKGEFRKLTRLAEDDNLTLYADDETKMTLDLIRKSGDHPDATPESMLRAHLQRIEPGNYLALMAFIERTDEVEPPLQAFRLLLRDTCNVPTTLGYGPRFLHSTGQFHKGGPNNGLFIQITAGDPEDVEIPGDDHSFAVLKDAQALGDFIALRERGRRVIRVHLRNDVLSGLVSLLDIAARLSPAP